MVYRIPQQLKSRPLVVSAAAAPARAADESCETAPSTEPRPRSGASGLRKPPKLGSSTGWNAFETTSMMPSIQGHDDCLARARRPLRCPPPSPPSGSVITNGDGGGGGCVRDGVDNCVAVLEAAPPAS